MIRVGRSLALVFFASAALAACMGMGEPDDEEIAILPLTQVSSGSVTATLAVSASSSNYTAQVTVRNGGSTATSAWSVAIALGSATRTNSWSAVFSGNTGNVTAQNMPDTWNRVIQPGGSMSFGWNANGTARPELTGMSATVGSTGTAGNTGSTGTAGTTGRAGTTGSAGTTGAGGTTGSAGTTGAGNTTGGVTAPPAASGSGSTCDRFGQIGAGSYFAQNNVWNTAAGSQCISLSGTALTVTSATHNLNPNQAPYMPAAYPSFVRGCHYNRCTDTFPRQVSGTTRMPSTFSIARAAGTWNASYDIWLDPTARRDGANTGLEIMIWIDYSGTPVPIGSRAGTVTLAGSSWEVWVSNGNENGSSRTISYRRGQNNTALTNFDAMVFINDAVSRGVAQRSWYVTSVQAGFEIWNGGTNLRVNSFSVGAQ